ncbi:MAG TPA: hypothetical protein VK095_01715 [Beutenbergiaceae bacterium]|nr:hypothetical protein [Beutenbergiaceae bacterium]
MTEAMFGFLGAVIGAAVSALVVWHAGRSDRVQREDVATADRRQRHNAARKDQWWSRAQWALDLILRKSDRSRVVGWEVLHVLGSSEWADARELRIIEAVARSIVRQVDASDDPRETEGSGGEVP